MAELEANLAPYNAKAALAADRVDSEKCFVLNTGRDNDDKSVASLKHVEDTVHDYFLCCHDLKVPVTKMYIVGWWNLDPATKEALEQETSSESYNEQVEYRKSRAEQKEIAKAGELIMELIVQMPKLKELTWISKMPVIPAVLEKLPPLTKLVLDLGQFVHLYRDGALLHRSYMVPNEMNVLQQQTQLKELRLFRMHDSFQPMVWETVFRNKSEGGMRVVDLQMHAPPIIRSGAWRKADAVDGMSPPPPPKEVSFEKEYKGMDGKGVLHYSFGTGEYLDDFCMRRARIASGLNEAKPAPLCCLKLDGFVIDHLPFLSELSHLVFLSCGDNCVDAGLRAPTAPLTVPTEWRKTVNDTTARCVVQWPTWIGAFDDQGKAMNTKIELPGKPEPEASDVKALDKYEQFRRDLGLTKEALEINELAAKLEAEQLDSTAAAPDADNASSSGPSMTTSSMVVQPSVRAVSNGSSHGSGVLPDTPVLASIDGPQSVPSTDGFALTSDSAAPVLVPVLSTELSASPSAHDGVFDGCLDMDSASAASTVEEDAGPVTPAATRPGLKPGCTPQ